MRQLYWKYWKLFVHYLDEKPYTFYEEAPDGYFSIDYLQEIFNCIYLERCHGNYHPPELPMIPILGYRRPSGEDKIYITKKLVKCLQKCGRLFPKNMSDIDYLNVIVAKDSITYELILNYGLNPQKYFARIINMGWNDGYLLSLKYGAIFDEPASHEYMRQPNNLLQQSTNYYNGLFKLHPLSTHVYVDPLHNNPQFRPKDAQTIPMFLSFCRTAYFNVIKHFCVDHQSFYQIDLNMRDYNGNTCLYYASLSNNFKLVRLLLEAGADSRMRNNTGQSMWDILCKNEKFIDAQCIPYYFENMLLSDSTLIFRRIPSELLAMILSYYRANYYQ
jgi:hypothetical protein